MDKLEKQDYIMVLAIVILLGMAIKLWDIYSLVLIVCVILIVIAWGIVLMR